MNTKYLYLHTIGCQMNVYDSEQIAMRLAPLGYEQTATMDRADLIIINTCAVRAKAEQKAFSLLGRLARMKRNKRRLIIGVGGCVAQQEGEKILKRMPHLDFVFGTQAVGRLPGIILCTDIGAFGDKKFNDRLLAVLYRRAQQGPAHPVSRIDIGAL